MPCGEDSARYGSRCHGGEVGFGQTYSEAGILHADFDGEGHCFFPGEAYHASDGKSQGIAQAVVKNNDQEDDADIGDDGVLAAADDASDDEGDGDGGNCWGVVSSRSGQFRQEGFHGNAQADRNDNDLEDGDEHADRVKGDFSADEHIGNSRGKDWRKYGGYGSHGDRQCQVPFTHEGDDIGGGAARAGAYQNDTSSQSWVQLEHGSQAECQERHDEELGYCAEEYIFWPFEDQHEVFDRKGGAHAEHDNP